MPKHEEENFPRGGTVVKSGTKRKSSNEDKDLFETDIDIGGKSKNKRPKLTWDQKKLTQKKKKKKEKDLKQRQFGLNITNVNILTHKTVADGMLVLGVVKKVNDYNLAVSLPSGLSGTVQITQICDAYTQLLQKLADGDMSQQEDLHSLQELFHVGMVIRCRVIDSKSEVKKGDSKIKLSINPSEVHQGLQSSTLKNGMVLSGCVSSKEDHGYVIDIGMKGTHAFLKTKAANKFISDNDGRELYIGSYVHCMVSGEDRMDRLTGESRTINVILDTRKVYRTPVTADMNVTMATLLPGMAITSSITKTSDEGVIVKFLGYVGSIHRNHLQASPGKLEKVQELKASILYVHPATKAVALTCLTHLVTPDLAPRKPFGDLTVGSIIEEAKVFQIDKFRGVFFKVNDELKALAYKTQLSDKEIPDIHNKFKKGTEYKCRVLDFDYVDNVVIVTLKESVLNQKYMKYSDLEPGALVKCEVKKILADGVKVQLCNQIRGYIPRIHLADVPLKHPEKRFNPGDQIKCRVLTVDPSQSGLILTCKKSLVTSKFPTITSFSQLKKNLQLEGVVVSIKDKGLVVVFYNNIKGFVPQREMSTEFIEYPEKVFFVGQMVRCQVMSLDADQEKAVLTLKVTGKSPFGSKHVKLPEDFAIGKFADVKIKKKTVKGLDVEVVPSGLPAFIPLCHLSDHEDNCTMLYGAYSEGDIIKTAMYIGTTNVLTMTCKPILIEASQKGQLVQSFEDLKPGMLLAGFLRKVMSYGVFMDLLHGQVGLAPNKFLSDRRVADPAALYKEGQSLVAKVTEKNDDKKRFLLSLKMADCYHGDTSLGLDFVQQYFVEHRKVMEIFKLKKGPKLKLTSLSMGQVLNVKVTEVNKHGALCALEKGVKGFATIDHMPGIQTESGQTIEAVVLHVDLHSVCVELSFNKDLVKAIKNHKENKFSQIREGQVIKSEVHLVKKEFVLVGLRGHAAGRLAYLPSRKHPNDEWERQQFCIGQVNSIVIKRVGSVVLGSLKIHELDQEEEGSISESTVVKPHNLTLGMITTATIKKVLDYQINISIEETPGRVHVSEIADDIKDGTNPMHQFKPGQKIKVKVIAFREGRTNGYLPISSPKVKVSLPECTMKKSKLSSKQSSEEKLRGTERSFTKGQTVQAFVQSVSKGGMKVIVSPGVKGRIDLLNLSTDAEVLMNPEASFKPGECYNCKVLRTAGEHMVDLSCTDGKLAKVEVNKCVEGVVTSVSPGYGLTVHLPQGCIGHVALTDISDSYTDNPTQNFSEGQSLKCFIVKCNQNMKNKYVLSLRNSKLYQKTKKGKAKVLDPVLQSLSDVKVKSNVRGFVSVCNSSGLFVRLSSELTGRVKLCKLSQHFVKNPESFFTPGFLVTVNVRSVDEVAGFIDLSMLETHTRLPECIPQSMIEHKSQTKQQTEEMESPKPEEKKLKKRKRKEAIEENGEEVEEKKAKIKQVEEEDSEDSDDSEDTSDSEDSDDSGVETKDSDADDKVSAVLSSGPRLSVSTGFSWDNTFSMPVTSGVRYESDSDESDSEDKPQKTKKTKADKKREQQEDEKRVYLTEQRLLDNNREPESAVDFDRLVLQSPDSSLVWLRYMAFHLQTTEIEKARAVAERALKSISFREEQEKLNVWVALMNLENMYGTHESLTSVFERAIQHNEPADVYTQLINIYVRSGKSQAAEQLYNQMVKRFSLRKEVWINFGLFYHKDNKADMARKLMQRSLKSLDKKDHVETITKFAQMEFKYGEPERGKTMFENILSSYPKRTDLWLVYIELMVKLNDPAPVRQLFERVIHLSLSAKKMKTLFKKYLDFEQKFGTEETVALVKQKAIEYVESKAQME